MTVQDIAQADVVTMPRTATVQEVAQRLDKERIGSIVIVDDGTPVGLVTDRDLAVRVVGQGRDPTALAVEKVMSTPLETIPADAGVYEAIDELANHGVRRMPIVEDDGTLVGILTLDDLFGVMTSEFALLESVLLAQAKSPRRRGENR